MGKIHSTHRKNAETLLAKRLSCPHCATVGLHRCEPTAQAGDNPSFRCMSCGVKFIVTNPSSLYPPKG